MPQPTGFLPNDLYSPKGSGDKERSVTARAGATKGRKKWEWKHELLSHGPALCNPMDWGPPGSSVHGILQARILECIANPFSWGCSWPRDRTQVSHIADRFLTIWATRIKGIQGRWHGQGNGETPSPPAPATHTPSTSPSGFPVDVPWWSSYYKIQNQTHSTRLEIMLEGTGFWMMAMASAHLSLFHSFNERFEKLKTKDVQRPQ